MTKHDAERKVKILDFIAATLRARGFPPSVREIAKAVGLASTSAVHHHLQILEREGFLERGAAQSRAIRLTPHAAMRLGLNHPRGPFEWVSELGAGNVVATLDALHERTGEPRYEVAPLLRERAATGA